MQIVLHHFFNQEEFQQVNFMFWELSWALLYTQIGPYQVVLLNG